MSDGSPIEWLNIPGTKPATWNPIRARHKTSGKTGWHCEHIHEGCTNCYAERQNKAGARGGTQLPYKPGHRKDINIYLDEKTLLAPLHWKAPRTIFVCSMTDLYGNWVSDEWLDKIKQVQHLTPQHTYIELTKRPERMRAYSAARTSGDPWAEAADAIADLTGLEDHPFVLEPRHIPLPNVGGLVSCSTQEDADAFIPILLNTPLAIRGVSLEPLLGPIDLRLVMVPGSDNGESHYRTSVLHGAPRLDWVIIGGESGKNARPMHPDWPRAIIEQCHAVGVPCFFKQWGEWAPYDRGHINSAVLATPKSLDTPIQRFGKKLAGRLLDGIEHNGFPQARGT